MIFIEELLCLIFYVQNSMNPVELTIKKSLKTQNIGNNVFRRAKSPIKVQG